MQNSEAVSQIGYGGMVGASPQMESLYRQISRVGQGAYPVLVLGESGTGKELVARSIHFAGPWRAGPFVAVDCTALSAGLVESELFGHVRGAFTGAERARQGLMESANGGVLFLDEIGDLDPTLQAKLLRTIQEKEIRPVGSSHCIPLHIRLIAATNRDLKAAVQKGTFRQDLFFRLNVVQLDLPALRHHKSDIPLLARHLVEKFTQVGEISKNISAGCMARLVAYDWPGNVRELGNAIERAMAFSVGATLEVSDLPEGFQPNACEDLPGANDTLVLEEIERRAIYRALQQTSGNVVAAALLLDIGKTTLYRKVKIYRDHSKAIGPV